MDPPLRRVPGPPKGCTYLRPSSRTWSPGVDEIAPLETGPPLAGLVTTPAACHARARQPVPPIEEEIAASKPAPPCGERLVSQSGAPRSPAPQRCRQARRGQREGNRTPLAVSAWSTGEVQLTPRLPRALASRGRDRLEPKPDPPLCIRQAGPRASLASAPCWGSDAPCRGTIS